MIDEKEPKGVKMTWKGLQKHWKKAFEHETPLMPKWWIRM